MVNTSLQKKRSPSSPSNLLLVVTPVMVISLLVGIPSTKVQLLYQVSGARIDLTVDCTKPFAKCCGVRWNVSLHGFKVRRLSMFGSSLLPSVCRRIHAHNRANKSVIRLLQVTITSRMQDAFTSLVPDLLKDNGNKTVYCLK